MSLIRAFIFDLDGTLADTLPDIGAAMNAALSEFGLPAHPLNAYRQMVGEGAEALAERALGGRTQTTPQALVHSYRQQYSAVEHQFSQPYPGVTDMLRGLVQRRVPIAVLSNKRHDFTQATVQHHFGDVPFHAVCGEREAEGVPRKPDPTAALELALSFNILPARIGFVGDTAIDMQTALAADMVPLGVTWGFRPEELSAHGARHLLQHPAELLQLLEARCQGSVLELER